MEVKEQGYCHVSLLEKNFYCQPSPPPPRPLTLNLFTVLISSIKSIDTKKNKTFNMKIRFPLLIQNYSSATENIIP